MPSRSTRTTIIDVARLAGVSRQTVTRALNGLADVKPATRDRVVAAARTLNYRPDRAAQSLVRGRRTTVGFVIDDLTNPYFAELASVLSREAARHGWGLLLCDVGTDADEGRAQLAAMVQSVDAVVMTGCRSDTFSMLPGDVLRGDGLRIPIVMIDGPAHPRLDARIVLDFAPAVTAALDHLRRSGRRAIAFIDSAEGTPDRRAVHRRYLDDHDLLGREWPRFAGEETVDGGIRAAEDLLRRVGEVDAVLVYNDVMAIGVLKALRRAGRAVPDDVAVIGIDGLELGRATTPELTTLAVDKTALAQAALAAVQGVLSRAATEEDVPADASIGLSLLLRESA